MVCSQQELELKFLLQNFNNFGQQQHRQGPWDTNRVQRPSGGLLGPGGQRPASGLLGPGPEPQGPSKGPWDGRPQGSGGPGHKTWHSGKNSTGEGGQRNKNQENSKSNKNYLPKIKEEGSKPKYYSEEFEQLAGKFLQCSLCKKGPMWDGESFVKHLLGNTHNKALEKLIDDDILRVAKLRKVIANQIRAGDGLGDSKCGMCDVKVRDIMKHRKDEGHKNMKQFIHPHCEPCSADFEDRSEWYYHKFSSYHLHNLERWGNNTNYSPSSSKDIDALLTRLEKKVSNKVKEVDDDEVTIIDDDNNDPKPNKNTKQDDSNIGIDNMTVIGSEYIKPVNGLFCKLCKKFFMNDKSEIVSHCHSLQHKESVELIEKQTGIKRKAAADFFDQTKKIK